jgi:hypothetical protein
MSDNLSLISSLNSHSQTRSVSENAATDDLSFSSDMSTEEKLMTMETPISRFLASSEGEQLNTTSSSAMSTHSAVSLNQPPLNATEMGRLISSPRLTPLGVGLAGTEVFEKVTDYYSVESASTTMGFDLSTAQGLQAARAYVWGGHNAGIISPQVQTTDHREIAAQAISLYELANPGSLGRAVEDNSFNDQKALTESVNIAIQAYEDNRLTLRDGEMAQGWIEVFPELTPDEKELTKLPGFTPERVEQFTESYPAIDPAEQKNGGKYESPIQELGIPNRLETPIEQEGVDNKPYMAQESNDDSIGSNRPAGVGGNGASSEVTNLNGIPTAEVKDILSEAGFEGKKVSNSGWQRFSHSDGSEINIQWETGRVVRTPSPKYAEDGSRANRGQRLGPNGAEIPINLLHHLHPSEIIGK